jgi:pimeloyl-ACP methyl ester carboxylesterase
MIVWGDRDHIIPVHQGHEAHEAIPGSRLEIFEGAGHFPHCEQPERFVKVLTDFMTTTSAAQLSLAQFRELLQAAGK